MAISAHLNAIDCEMKFDSCRNEGKSLVLVVSVHKYKYSFHSVEDFPFVSQVLKMIVLNGSESEWDVLEKAFKELYDEHKHLTMDHVRLKKEKEPEPPKPA